MNGWLEPFTLPFMQNALIAGVLTSVICGVLGTYVVVRRMAFIGDALAHTTLPGLVGAYLLHVHHLLGALVAAILTALGIGWFTRGDQLREDTAIGVVFTGMLALGILAASTIKSYRALSDVLFGNLLSVSTFDLVLIAGIAAVVLIGVALFHKELELTAFDSDYASQIGIQPFRLRQLLLVLLALAVVVSIQAVGMVLTTALLVTPAASASLVCRRLDRMMLLACVLAAGCCVAGLYASFYLALPAGAAIALGNSAVFIAIWFGRKFTRGGRNVPHGRYPKSSAGQATTTADERA